MKPHHSTSRALPKLALFLGLGAAAVTVAAPASAIAGPASTPAPAGVRPAARVTQPLKIHRIASPPKPYRLRMELEMKRTTDSNENSVPLFDNSEDEIYYSLAGVTVISGQTIGLQRKMQVRPNNPSKDVWEMGPNSNDLLHRTIYEGSLGGLDSAAFTLVINEQDNAQLNQLLQLLKDIGNMIGTVLAQQVGVSDFLGTGEFDDKQALDTLVSDSKALLLALNDNKDQPVGVAAITMRGGTLRVTGIGGFSTVLSASTKAAELELTGFGSKYRLRLIVEDGNLAAPQTRLFLDRYDEDRCGETNLKIESKNGNVLVHKGETKEAYIKSDKYTWYCGGSDEKDNAPDATNLAVLTRAPSGRDMKWEWYLESTAVADYK
jgi:hypothetical protein